MKRWARWTVGIALGSALLITFLWQNENRRGKRIWEETCARLRAAGEPVELADIIPPMIPDEENVAMAPIFAEVFTSKETARLARYANAFQGRAPRRTTASGGEAVYPPFAKPLFAEDLSHLEEWREYLRAWMPGAMPSTSLNAADEILHYLKRWDGERREMQEALQRPKCRWPLRYEDRVRMEAPMFMVCLSIIHSDRPRLLAQAAKGDAAGCTETSLTDLRLSRAGTTNAPLLLGILFASTCDAIALQSLQQVLPVIRFSDIQLATLQQQLGMVSLAPVSQALCYERVVWPQTMLHLSLEDLEHIHRLGNLLPFESTPDDAQEMARSLVLLAMANRPEGWKLLDAAAYAAFIHDEVQPCVDETAGTILRSRVTAMEKALNARKSAAGPLSLEQDLPDYFSSILIKAAKHQALVREAGLWCAVERFRHKFDRIPDRLEELVPEFIDKLPNDPVNGLPLHYVRKGESDYLLYSVGWNERDDGGIERRSSEKGDWVWASDPRLIKNPDQEKRKAEEAAEAASGAKSSAQKGKRNAERKAKEEAAAKRDAEWKEAMEKRNAQFRAKEEINKREREKAATGAGSK